MNLTSPSFQNNSEIPTKHTCNGANISPELRWSNVPDETKSFVLICDDPDAVAVAGFVWDHWLLFNISPDIRSIPEGHSAGTEGVNSFNKTEYGGPCPPNGKHRYIFTLYALDTTLSFEQVPTKQEMLESMKGHILDQSQLHGTYKRPK